MKSERGKTVTKQSPDHWEGSRQDFQRNQERISTSVCRVGYTEACGEIHGAATLGSCVCPQPSSGQEDSLGLLLVCRTEIRKMS